MGWMMLIVLIGGIIYGISQIDPLPKIKTESGDITIDTTVIQCENIPQGVGSNILTTPSEVVVTSNGFKKVIPHNDIIDVSTELSSEMVGGSQFSVGKAVAGAVMLGGIGAIGGFAGNKDYNPKMMIISFTENDEVNYMVFLQKTPSRDKKAELKFYGELLDIACKEMNGIIKRIN